MVEVTAQSFEEQVDLLTGLSLCENETALRDALESVRPEAEQERSALVPSRSLVPPARMAERVQRRDQPLVLGHLEPDDLETFQPIDAVALPATQAYLVVDVDLGAGSRNERPEDALREILDAGRSPLTIEEGLALMLLQPEVIAPNWGFSMAGSRRGDQRVPALWISEGRPKLGWCWDRNPHTWLGTASCARRWPSTGWT